MSDRSATQPGSFRSRSPRRWPERNFRAELASDGPDQDLIDAAIAADPKVSRVRKRVSAVAHKMRGEKDRTSWITYADLHALLRSAEVEASFNLGFENGVLLGRSEALREREVKENRPAQQLGEEFRVAVRRLLAGNAAPTDTAARILVELSWALMGEPARAARSRR